MSTRALMSCGRYNISGNLPRVDLPNASLTIEDDLIKLRQTSRILDLVNILGDAWTFDYDPRQVTSNQVGSRYVLLQFSNGLLQNVRNLYQLLEDTLVLEGPYLVSWWECHGK